MLQYILNKGYLKVKTLIIRYHTNLKSIDP